MLAVLRRLVARRCTAVLLLSALAAACDDPATPTPTTPDVVAPSCSFSIPSDQRARTVDSGRVELPVDVVTSAGCAWTATTSADFIALIVGPPGSGAGRVRLVITENAGAERTGRLTIAGLTVSITQRAPVPPECAFAVTPTDVQVPAAAGSFSLQVHVAGGTSCPWSAVSTEQFLSITSGETGTVSGAVDVTVAENTGAARTGSVVVAGVTVTVSQAAPAAPPPSPPPPPPPANPVMVLSYQSDPQDLMGLGQSATTTYLGPDFSTTTDGTGSLTITTMPLGSWRIQVTAPAGQPLTPGLYDDAARPPFQPAGASGFHFTGNGRACGSVSARFLIAEITFSGTGVSRFHAKFEQHCDNSSAALRGEIWIDDQGVMVPPPVASLPTGPVPPSTLFSYVSEPGDSVGQGQTRTFTLADATFSALDPGPVPRVVSISVRETAGTFSSIRLQAPTGQALAPGAFENALRFPTPANPAVDVGIGGRGCNMTTGRFVVLDIAVGASGHLRRFHATFEQHCEGGAAALRGEVHIVADPWR